ncbi:MAG: type II toxin-antitoxin system VapC family toxin [Fimbriimonadaceae bacterium]
MIVDSSAIVAVLNGEPERGAFLSILAEAKGSAKMSAATYVEIGIVIDSGKDPTTSRRVDELLSEFEIGLVEVTSEHALIARSAYRDFGRGSGHPARLNFGDTFVFALATVTGEPVLCKGDDFAQTNLAIVKH